MKRGASVDTPGVDIIALGGLLLVIFGLESARRIYYSSGSTNEARMATPMSERREGLERLIAERTR